MRYQMNSLAFETVRDFIHVNTRNSYQFTKTICWAGLFIYEYLSSALVWYAFVIFTNLSSENLLKTLFGSVKSSSHRINYHTPHLPVLNHVTYAWYDNPYRHLVTWIRFSSTACRRCLVFFVIPPSRIQLREDLSKPCCSNCTCAFLTHLV